MIERLEHFFKRIIPFILYPLSFPFIEKILINKIKKNPNNINALWFLSICYFGFGRYLEAQDLLKALIKIRPNRKYIKFLARVHYKKEQYNKVVEMLSNPGILTDKDVDNFYLAQSLFMLKEFYGAAKYFNVYVKYYPNHYDPFVRLGYCYYMEKMYDLSLEAYRKADKLNPCNKDITDSVNLCIEMINERQLNGELASSPPAPQIH